jgi:preprotein translocase subunit SecA
MLTWVAKKLFGTANERAIKRMRPRVAAINALEEQMKALSDSQLTAKTAEFKQKLANGATLDDLLHEAFAVCREGGRRALRMRHYDVQLMGGMVLHQGCIAEMKTGEGKTLVATLPIYLNALEGRGVHLVTVNDYLARRDAEWMGQLYKFLGMSVGVIVNQQQDAEKKAAYKSDICYGQNNEFGFDYLRDNMKFSALDYVQRELNFAIVDEVDSILIDEARTPLIISGPADAASDKYRALNEIIPRLRKDEHYNVDEKAFGVTLTDEGVELVQKLTGLGNLYDPVNVQTLHILNQLLRAHALYKRDVHYMVGQDSKVMIIDEFTGRVLPGRRWSDGLHQAVEAKENVRIQEESRTMATITFQNLFRQYKKIAGMTGTAQTEASEFHSTYKLDVTAIPTNKNISRSDQEDVVYKTEREKFTAVIADILERNKEGRPVLVGTTSVEKSAAIASILKRKNVAHAVLNAKHHENEAYVVAQAGRKGAITVSTNMAGRGTDILLGGNPEMIARMKFKEANRSPDAEAEAFQASVKEVEELCKKEHDEVVALGGLHIVGTERHESRRIDNQLRGRAGRQGDPGSSKFYLSLEDDLMRIFAGDRVKNLMDRMGMPDDEPIEHPWVTKSVENAQRKVEERNFDIRKNLLEYDDVMNAQRKTVYSLRQQLLMGSYTPEETDELGKPTGKTRDVPVDPEIQKQVEPMVAQLVGMFCKVPLQPKDANGASRAPTQEELAAAAEVVELSALQREVYHMWGARMAIPEQSEGQSMAALQVCEQLVTLVSKRLSEQRERLLDLMDRVVSAMVAESCPQNRPPEDWDWAAIHDGFREHFRVKLSSDVDNLGDIEQVARFVYSSAEKAYKDKEKKLGVENILRAFRYFYLEEIDKAWVDHLTNMEHLRDGIGLRGYGQRDPKNEYKKEGYDMFLNMMGDVSSNVLSKLYEFIPKGVDEIEQMEAAAETRHEKDLAAAVARHPGADGEVPPPTAGPGIDQQRKAASLAPPSKAAAPKVGRNDPCPCGSGKKFKQCHGAPLFDDDEESGSATA